MLKVFQQLYPKQKQTAEKVEETETNSLAVVKLISTVINFKTITTENISLYHYS